MKNYQNIISLRRLLINIEKKKAFIPIKKLKSNKAKYFVVKGYGTVYEVYNAHGTKFLNNSLSKEWKQKNNSKQIPLLFDHNWEIYLGGTPIEKIEDHKYGIYIEAYINLDLQEGQKMKEKVINGEITAFSLGWTNIQMKGQDIVEVILREVSLTDNPANPIARIIEYGDSIDCPYYLSKA